MNPSAQHRLILMLKYPQPGAVKTRLVPALGERRACELYRALVRRTLDEARRWQSQSSATLAVRLANAPAADAVRRWLGDEIQLRPRGEGDLGERMERAVQEA